VSAAPVDVLRVLDHYAAEFTKRFGPDNEFVATRAAVAELIEAAKGIDGQSLGHDGAEPRCDDCVAIRRLTAALARVGAP
jgi:hypothetical protein